MSKYCKQNVKHLIKRPVFFCVAILSCAGKKRACVKFKNLQNTKKEFSSDKNNKIVIIWFKLALKIHNFVLANISKQLITINDRKNNCYCK